jgi:hypothetical protein
VKLTTGRLEIELEGHDVKMTGQIDERCELGELEAKLGDRASFDLERVSFINSIGVRAWVQLLRTLRDRGVAVVLRRCSEEMTHQMNMIADVAAGARVESFFAPYMCAACGHEASRCVEIEPNLAALRRLQAPTLPCGECPGTMELNEIPARYLYFVEAVP